MLTKENLQQLKEAFPTKEETNRRFTTLDEEMNHRFNDVNRRFDEMDRKFDEKYGELVSSQDYIVKLLEARRDEDAIAAAEDRFFRRQLEDHERRIIRLEQPE